MKPVLVLGSGQLGRMLKQAGEPLGIDVHLISEHTNESEVAHLLPNAIITAEVESWPVSPLTTKLSAFSTFINKNVFSIIADRLTQKQLFDDLNLPTANWQAVTDSNQLKAFFKNKSDDVIIKRRKGGYDGKGQYKINQNQLSELPSDIYHNAIAEQCIHFDGEASLVAARCANGQMAFYPLTYNYHHNGILLLSVAPFKQNEQLQTKAQNMLTKIMNKLDYVGVMAMECFIKGDELLINELAPRVHNSGHWTQNGASISQFELHLRAILDLPLPKPMHYAPAIMINLIGEPYNINWLSQPFSHLHWYQKEVKTGRKLGHINITHQDVNQIIKTFNELLPFLPPKFSKLTDFTCKHLN